MWYFWNRRVRWSWFWGFAVLKSLKVHVRNEWQVLTLCDRPQIAGIQSNNIYGFYLFIVEQVSSRFSLLGLDMWRLSRDHYWKASKGQIVKLVGALELGALKFHNQFQNVFGVMKRGKEEIKEREIGAWWLGKQTRSSGILVLKNKREALWFGRSLCWFNTRLIICAEFVYRRVIWCFL